MQVQIYTDGSARGNPDGPGGYGTVLHYTDAKGELHVREYSQGYVRTTNNRMELMAAIVGLEALNRPCEVELYSDSQYRLIFPTLPVLFLPVFYPALVKRIHQVLRI